MKDQLYPSERSRRPASLHPAHPRLRVSSAEVGEKQTPEVTVAPKRGLAPRCIEEVIQFQGSEPPQQAVDTAKQRRLDRRVHRVRRRRIRPLLCRYWIARSIGRERPEAERSVVMVELFRADRDLKSELSRSLRRLVSVHMGFPLGRGSQQRVPSSPFQTP
jgi:hypothetical protein